MGRYSRTCLICDERFSTDDHRRKMCSDVCARERLLAKKRAERRKNADQYAERGKAWLEANRDSHNARRRKRYADGDGRRSKGNKYNSERRARLRGVEVEFYDRHDVLAKTGGICSYCGCDLEDDWHVDHVHPISKGGGDVFDNVVPSCPPCNLSKGSSTDGY